MPRCQSITIAGNQCRRNTQGNSQYCPQHAFHRRNAPLPQRRVIPPNRNVPNLRTNLQNLLSDFPPELISDEYDSEDEPFMFPANMNNISVSINSVGSNTDGTGGCGCVYCMERRGRMLRLEEKCKFPSTEIGENTELILEDTGKECVQCSICLREVSKLTTICDEKHEICKRCIRDIRTPNCPFCRKRMILPKNLLEVFENRRLYDIDAKNESDSQAAINNMGGMNNIRGTLMGGNIPPQLAMSILQLLTGLQLPVRN